MDFKKEIEKISVLARIELSEKDKTKFSKELNKILDHFNILQKADVKGIQPFLTHSESRNVFRNDEAKTCFGKEILKDDFLDKQGNYLKIKSVKKEWEL
ncbi:MAG: Asp-tRNA(Asn)/Glu-tRNA(Gln) amidotransferase subunit GatC [bacterium]|nr:Asp-tRNA(Asn)/Glu-tRNA(Gln) amidotransferase subunit GatC [bacterium]